ncbi:MAG: aminopeptidase [Candidatus Hadarchaeum sp.]|nr:aminopeptidase [Candidatus Hadarchaeum sp.]
MGLLKATRIAVRTCMGVKPSESVLIVTDKPRVKIAEAIRKAAEEVAKETLLMVMRERTRHGEEPPKAVEKAMCAADVVFAPTTYSLTHTQARLRATKAGARIATMPMITEDMMMRGAMLADYKKVRTLTMKVVKLLNKASEVEIETRAGTELYMSIANRKAHPDTGIFHNPGDFGNLPAGEAFIAPVEGTAEGRVIVDGSMVDRVRGTVEIMFEKGFAQKIAGSPAPRLEKMLRKAGLKAMNLAEFGIGTNPKAKLIGNVLEDEKVLGTCHIALGDNSTFGGRVKAGIHVDGIIKHPTIKLDGKIVMREGTLKL